MRIESGFDLEKLVNELEFIDNFFIMVEKLIEDKVRVKCYNEARTGEFSQFEENYINHYNSFSSVVAGSARVQVNLEIDLLLHGWTEVIKKVMKPGLFQEVDEIDGTLYYQGRIAQENLLKTQDLDDCTFLGFIEIGHNVIITPNR